MYLQDGLKPPIEVTAMTQDYMENQDEFSLWLEKCVKCPIQEGGLASELFGNYQKFCEYAGEPASLTSTSALGRKLCSIGIDKKKVHAGSRYGLRIQLEHEVRSAFAKNESSELDTSDSDALLL